MNIAVGTLMIEPFTAEHLPDAERLSQQVSWPHRAEDWALTLSQSDGVVAKLDGQVVGTALVSIMGDVATLSMIIVDEAQRGKRIGCRLMEAIIDIAGDREKRLIATAEGLPLYEKLGFRTTGHIEQFQGIVADVTHDSLVKVGFHDIKALTAMDKAANGLDRGDLLVRICAAGTVFHTPKGFAILRDFGRGKVVGPIIAEDFGTAKALLTAAAKTEEGGFLRIDTPDPKIGNVAESIGLKKVGGGTCMSVSQKESRSKTDYQTFALVSQALG